MKRRSIINITVIAYFIALAAMFYFVYLYVKVKDERLEDELRTEIQNYFGDKRRYIDIAYSGYKVGYEEVPIPSESILQTMYNKYNHPEKQNESKYGDLSKMYRLFYKKSDWPSPRDYRDGWNLVVFEQGMLGRITLSFVFPYAVGYIKQDESWMYNYAPSVSTAVSEALDFYTKNEKSDLYESFVKGCYNSLWPKILYANNEYYYLGEDEEPAYTISGTPLFDKLASEDDTPYYYQNGFMYNGFYKVFVAGTNPKTFSIQKKSWNPDKQDRKKMWIYWTIGLTALMLLIVTPLSIIERKHNKEKDENIYDKLLRLCKPSNFVTKGQYDKDKVDKANEIYKRLLEISADDKNALDEILAKATSELGLNLINQDKLNELKMKVNPQNFMSPYNAEKVSLANELYAILTKEGLTYSEFADVEEKMKLLGV